MKGNLVGLICGSSVFVLDWVVVAPMVSAVAAAAEVVVTRFLAVIG